MLNNIQSLYKRIPVGKRKEFKELAIKELSTEENKVSLNSIEKYWLCKTCTPPEEYKERLTTLLQNFIIFQIQDDVNFVKSSIN